MSAGLASGTGISTFWLCETNSAGREQVTTLALDAPPLLNQTESGEECVGGEMRVRCEPK
jgi:hypothetical protein